MRMFKNCPYDKYGRTSCEGCPLFWRCLVKKLRRKLNKRRLTSRILWVIFIIILLVLVAWLNIEKAKKEERNRLIEQRKDVAVTKEVTTNEIKVTTLSSKAKIVAKPTFTPIPTRKVEDKHQYENIVLSATPKAKVTKRPKKVKAKKVAKVKGSSKSKVSAAVLKDYASLSAYDRKLMEKMVYAESRGEPYEGQVAVAAVILNRYIFYKKEKSIEKVITEKGQFADISNVTENMLKEYPDCKKAVEEAIKGNDPTREKFSEGARCFYNPKKVSDYQRKKREGVPVLIIGHHHFHNDFNE